MPTAAGSAGAAQPRLTRLPLGAGDARQARQHAVQHVRVSASATFVNEADGFRLVLVPVAWSFTQESRLFAWHFGGRGRGHGTCDLEPAMRPAMPSWNRFQLRRDRHASPAAGSAGAASQLDPRLTRLRLGARGDLMAKMLYSMFECPSRRHSSTKRTL